MVANYTQTESIPSFVDRSLWIRFLGLCQILIGLVPSYFALGGILILLMHVAGKTSLDRMVLSSSTQGTVQSVAIAAVLFWTGRGCLRLRRWANHVILAISFPWLLLGTVYFARGASMVPERLAEAAASGESISDAERVLILLFLVGGFVTHTIFPAILATFHSRASVRRTFRVHNPEPVWTDTCPLAVLGLAFVYGYVALNCASSAFSATALFFGKILSGAPAVAVTLSSAVICASISAGLYRQRMLAWGIGLAWTILAGLSVATSFAAVQAVTFYTQMGASAEVLERVKRFDYLWEQRGLLYTVGAVAMFVYHLVIFRFLRRTPMSQ